MAYQNEIKIQNATDGCVRNFDSSPNKYICFLINFEFRCINKR